MFSILFFNTKVPEVTDPLNLTLGERITLLSILSPSELTVQHYALLLEPRVSADMRNKLNPLTVHKFSVVRPDPKQVSYLIQSETPEIVSLLAWKELLSCSM